MARGLWSSARTSPVGPMPAAMRALFPPPPAQASRTRCPSQRSSARTGSAAASSMGISHPSSKPGSSRGLPAPRRVKLPGTNRPGVTPGEAAFRACAAPATSLLSRFTTTVRGDTRLLAAIKSPASAGPSRRIHRSTSHDGWEPAPVQYARGSPIGSGSIRLGSRITRRRTAFTYPAARPAPTARASVTVSIHRREIRNTGQTGELIDSEAQQGADRGIQGGHGPIQTRGQQPVQSALPAQDAVHQFGGQEPDRRDPAGWRASGNPGGCWRTRRWSRPGGARPGRFVGPRRVLPLAPTGLSGVDRGSELPAAAGSA